MSPTVLTSWHISIAVPTWVPPSHRGTLIHRDQMGFIPDRLSFSNTRCLLNFMYSTNPSDYAVMSLDAKQAFDQIEWGYMFATHKKIWFCQTWTESEDSDAGRQA